MRYPVPALWRCRVVAVHDGDSVVAVVDRGIDETATWEVRLKDVWCPEVRKKEIGAIECRDHATGWVVDHSDGTLWPFLLETFRTPRSDTEQMSFSRYIGVIKDAGGSSLNVAMIGFVAEKGYAGGTGS